MMLSRSFAQRAAPSTLPERMDDPAVDEATLAGCLASLASVNRLSFGYRPTLRFVDRLTARHGSPDRPLRILDVGSGYGDTLRQVARSLARKDVAAELVGADLNEKATRVAEAASRDLRERELAGRPVTLSFVTEDARRLGEADDGAPFDAIICALFTHHLEDDELVEFLRFLDGAARLGWFINDLYRSRFAAVGFGALATTLRRHPFVRHDGPVSFARAFRKPDWERLLAEANVTGARIAIGAPFRLCVERLA